MKYYSALYLTERPPVALPPEAKIISFQPHITLSVFESDKAYTSIEKEILVSVGLSTYALHGRSTNQIMIVCPVVMNDQLRAVATLLPPDMRGEMIYHVTVGAMPMNDVLAHLYPNMSLVSSSSLTTVIKSNSLVIEQFNPVAY